LSWVSLLFCAIEPVLSSASATSSFLMPTSTFRRRGDVELVLTEQLVNVVGTLPDAVTWSVKRPPAGWLAGGDLNVAVSAG